MRATTCTGFGLALILVLIQATVAPSVAQPSRDLQLRRAQ